MYNPPCKHFNKLYHWLVPNSTEEIYICSECGKIVEFGNISKICYIKNISNDKIRKAVHDICRIFNTEVSGINDYIPASYNWLPNKEYRIVRKRK